MSDDKHLEPNPDEQPTIGIEPESDSASDDASLADQIILPEDKPAAKRTTITLDDLFEEDEEADAAFPPPLPKPQTEEPLVIELLDDEDTPTASLVLPAADVIDQGELEDDLTVTGPIVQPVDDPDSLDTPPIGNPTPTEQEEPPRFTPTERPPVIDAGATRVNPKVALPKHGLATRDAKGRSADDVRNQRRAAREAAQRRREREEARQQSQPTRVRPEPVQPAPPVRPRPPVRPQQPRPPARPPLRDMSHNANRVATRDTLEDKPQREGQGGVGNRPIPSRVVIPARPKEEQPQRNVWGCITRVVVGSLLLFIILLGLSAATLTYGYITITSDLPAARELETRTSTFQTVFIYDSNGDLLYQLADPTTGDRTKVSLDRISQDVINATIATEDSRFWDNPGFDPIAIGRAVSEVVLDGSFSRGDIAAAGGASTITQQLVRATLLSQDEANQTTVRRKVREIILAAELNRQWTRELGSEQLAKEKILEIYLNEIYYGNRSYGIEAASRTYFKKSAANLTLAEATLLAGLPQAPALWDPITAPEYALGRQSEVLTLMVAEGYVTADAAQSALNEVLARKIEPPSVNIRYPHFTLSVLSELESTYGSDILYNSGFRVHTTIRPEVQELAEQTLANNRATINAQGANNAALVALDPADGAILAMVGSLDYRDEAIRGQVNMARAPRQPGSTIKPFVFLASMERGYTPATLFWDVPSAFPDGVNPAYEPKNYDNEFHGPMLLRTALANSYNIPAVKALEAVGVCEFITRTQFWGLNLTDEGCEQTGTPRNVGLALSLGGSEISPLRMSSAYAMLANGGDYNRPFGIRRIEIGGQAIYSNGQPLNNDGVLVQVDNGEGVSAELAYLTTDMLADNNARIPEFGQNNLLNLPFPVAAKTGTSGTNEFDVRDVWTVGYTPNLVTAIWIGNTDNQPLVEGASGYRVASPVWNQFMLAYHAGREPLQFAQPEGVTQLEICRDSGAMANPQCELRRQEVFSVEQPPLSAEQHFYDATILDRWTLRMANEYCDDEATIRQQSFDLLVSGLNNDIKTRYRSEVETWLQGQGSWWANQYGITLPLPQTSNILLAEPCEQGTERPVARINEPSNGETLTGLVQIGGQATAPGFAGYQLEYGFGTDPAQWFPVDTFKSERQPGGRLGTWNVSTVEQGGDVTLRLTVFGADNPYTRDVVDRARKETRIVVKLLQPTAVPTETPTPTPSATPTSLPTATSTSVPPTATATNIPATDVPTVVPTATPTTEVLVPTTEPTATSEPTLAPPATEVLTVEPIATPTVEPTPDDS